MQKRACLTASLLIGIWPHTKPRSLFAALSFTPAPAIESRKTQKQRKTWTGFRVLRPFHPSAIQSRKTRKQRKTRTGFRALRPFHPSAIQSRKTRKQWKTWTGFRALRPFRPSAIQSRKTRKQWKTWTGFRALRPFRPSAIQSTGDGGPARGFVGQRSYLLPGEPPLAPARPRRYN